MTQCFGDWKIVNQIHYFIAKPASAMVVVPTSYSYKECMITFLLSDRCDSFSSSLFSSSPMS